MVFSPGLKEPTKIHVMRSEKRYSYTLSSRISDLPGRLGIGMVLTMLLFAGSAMAAVFTVSTTVDGVAGSLRFAIQQANSNLSATAGSPHIIDMTGISGTILLDSALNDLENHMILNGPSNNSLTIERNLSAPAFSVFTISPFTIPDVFVQMNNLIIRRGTSLTGGGIYAENCTLVINECQISRNFVNNGLGGGICTNNCQLTITNSTIDRNTNLAGLGGGIYMNFGSVIMNNCTVFANRAAVGGGIDKATVGSVIINNCTFAYDTADDAGGGLYINLGNIQINNTIVAGNFGSNGANDIFGNAFSIYGHNFISNTSGTILTGNTTGNPTPGVPGNFIVSNVLASNGGPTPTLLLVPCSFAIDGGTSAAYSNPATARDQRGLLRSSFGSSFDIGAVEYSGPVSSDQAICGPGQVTFTASAGTSYLWYDTPAGGLPLGFGSSFTTFVNSTSIFYLADFFNGCESNPRVAVVANVLPLAVKPIVTAGGPTTFCEGGSVLLTSSQDPSYVSLTWSPGGQTGSSINASDSAFYFVTATDANGCTNTSDSIAVTVLPNPTPVITASGSLDLCQGSQLLLVSSIPTGNSWNAGGTNDTLVVTAGGSYFTSVTDLQGCIGISNTLVVNEIPQPPVPTITSSGPTTFCEGGNVTLTSSATAGNLWSTGETTQSITVDSSGFYFVINTSTAGCSSDTAFILIQENPNPLINIAPPGIVSICSGSGVDLSASLSSGLLWSNGATTQTITVTTPGIFSVFATDANGCTAQSNSVQVIVSTPPSAPVITANGPLSFCDGNSVTLSSSATSGIVWSTGETTSSINATTSGNYSVVVSDANGCTALSNIISVTVTPGPPASVITSSVPTTFCDGGSVTLSSSIASNITWSTGETTQDITVTTSGIYTVSVSDGSGCSTESQPVQVTVIANPAVPLITASGPTILCQGGSVTLTSDAGPATVWSTGQTAASITINASQVVTATISNSAGCSATSDPVNVVVNPTPSAPTVTADNPSTVCSGTNVTLTSSSSDAYLWSPGGETTQGIVVNAAGTYSVTIFDGNGCSNSSAPFVLNVNTTPQATITGNPILCGGASGILTASSGSSWLWSNGETTQTIPVSASGTFTVTITDANNCTSVSAPFIVNAVLNPVVSVTPAGPIVTCADQLPVLTANFNSENLWSNGATTSAIIPSTNGNYFVTHTDANGCTGVSNTVSVTINPNPAPPVVTANGPTTFCSGDSVLLNAVGTGTISWSTGELGSSLVVDASGTYFAIVTDANGCSAVSNDEVVTVDTPPVAPNLGGPYVQCGGSVVLDAGNPGGSTTYLWSNGETTQFIDVLVSGSFDVTIGNSCGSVTSLPAIITINPLPTPPVVTSNGSTTICAGSSVTLTSSISSNIVWNNGETTASIVVSVPGTYFVVVTDANGCTSSSLPVPVLVDQQPVAPNLGGPYTQCGGSLVLNAGVFDGSTTYLWSNGEVTPSIIVTQSGQYSVTITNACGSVTSAAADVTINPLPTAPVITAAGPTTFCAGSSVLLSSNITTGNLWNTGATTQSILVTQPGTYSVSVSNSNGCSGTSNSITVVVDNPPFAPNLGGPYTQCGGSVTLNAGSFGGSSSFLWNTGETTQTISVSASGSYQVTVTNSCGSAVSSNALVIISPLPTPPVVTPAGPVVICSGSSVVLSTPDPGAGFGLLWNTGDVLPDLTVTAAGSYSVSLIDANGCSSSSLPVQVSTENLPVSPSLGGPYTQCGGSLVLDAGTSGTSYVWNNGATTQSISVSVSGDYFVEVSNSCGSVLSDTAEVTISGAPITPVIASSGPTTFCSGNSIDLSFTPDPSVVDVLWSSGETTNSITVNASGSYTVTTTDNNGCTATSQAIVVTVDSLLASPALGGPYNQCGGSVTLNAGTAATSYLWNNGATTQTIVVSVSGSYYVTVANTCGAVASDTAVVNIQSSPAAPIIAASGPTTFCLGDSVNLSITGGIGAGSILWSTSETTSTITVDSSGTFTVTITDANNCSATSAPLSVVVQTLPAAPALGGPQTQCGGIISLNAGPASTGTTYQWNNGASTQVVDVSASGSYFVSLTNACGTVLSDTADIQIFSDPGAPFITVSGVTQFCTGDSVLLTSSAANGNVWSTGDTSNSIVVFVSGDYFVNVNTGSPFCAANSDTVTVTVDSPLGVISLGADQTQCGGSVTLNTGVPSGTFIWTDLLGNNSLPATPSVNVSVTGSIFVAITNACNSVVSDTVNIVINPSPAAPVVTASGPVQFCIGDSVTLTATGGPGQNLVVNGTFSAGATGFTSDYILSTNLIPEQTYAVGPNANTFHPAFNGLGFGGSGNFLVVNGSSVAGLSVWTQTIAVEPNQTYNFNISVSSVVANNPGVLQLQVNGVNQGSTINCPPQVNVWTPYTISFNSGASTTVTLELLSTLGVAGGNDFGIDNVSLVCQTCTGTLLWSNGDSGNTTVITESGSYTVTITNGSGCSSTSVPVNVVVDTLPVAPVLGPDVVACQNSVVLNAGNPGASYLWSTGETTQSITLNTVGQQDVFVTVTTNCGVANSDTVNVIINGIPVFDLGGPFTVCPSASVTLDPLLSGTGFTYNWSTGQTTSTLSVSAAGTYSLTVTEQSGTCSFSDTAVVSLLSLPLVNLGPDTTLCGTAYQLDAGNPGFTYLWSTGATTQTISLSPPYLGPPITVAVTNQCGTSTSPAVNVLLYTTPPTPTISANGPTTFCQGDSVILTASSGSSYLWAPGGETTASIVVDASGSYTVTVAQAGGCTSTSAPTPVTVNAIGVTPAQITANGPTTFCLGGSVTLTSSNATGNVWLPTGNTNSSITIFNSTQVILLVQDANGCSGGSDTVDVVVNFSPGAFIISGANNNLCPGDSLSLTANSGTGFTYSWTGGATTQSIVVSGPGNYSVTVTDTNGCSSTSVPANVVAAPVPATPDIQSSGLLGCVSPNVTLSTTAQGGTLEWSTGEFGNNINVAFAGDYFVSITNNFGCTSFSDTITLVQSVDLQIALSSPVFEENGLNIRCYEGSDGKIDLSVNGGVEPFTYLWSNGATTASLENIKGGNEAYSVVVTDALGCTARQSITLTTPEDPLAQMPQGFSPDGNGINDVFIIPGIESFQKVQLWIYNRWGSEVFNSNGIYSNDRAWDGRGPSGMDLPDGTYFVVIEADSPECGTLQEQRYIELRRK